jgi:hypothetical protein
MSKKIDKALSKMTRQQQLSELMFRLQDFTNEYWGDDYDTDTCMATDISYLRGIIDELHAKNQRALSGHVNIASQCIALSPRTDIYNSDSSNPFA